MHLARSLMGRPELLLLDEHAALLRDGAILAAGPLHETLTDEAMSACFGLALRIHHRDGRWFAAAH